MAQRDLFIAGRQAGAGTTPIAAGWNSLHIRNSVDSGVVATVKLWKDELKTSSTTYILEAGESLDLQAKFTGCPVDIIATGGNVDYVYST